MLRLQGDAETIVATIAAYYLRQTRQGQKPSLLLRSACTAAFSKHCQTPDAPFGLRVELLTGSLTKTQKDKK